MRKNVYKIFEIIDNKNYIKLEEMINIENIESVNENKQTPLIYAVSVNDTKSSSILIDRRANVNCLDKKGYSALCYATMNDNVELVDKLLKNGAEVNIIVKTNDIERNLLIITTFKKNIEISKLLIQSKININYFYKFSKNHKTFFGKCNALIFALINKDFSHVKLLIENGIDVNYTFDYKNYSNFNVYAYSLLTKNIEIIKYIYEKTKNKFNSIQYLNRNDIENVTLITGMSSLEILIKSFCSDKEIFNFIFEQGIDFNHVIGYSKFEAIDNTNLIDDEYNRALYDVKHNIFKEEKMNNRDFIEILEDVNYYREVVQTIKCNMFVLYIIQEDDDNINKELIEFFILKGLDLNYEFEYEECGDSACTYIELADLLSKYNLRDYLDDLTDDINGTKDDETKSNDDNIIENKDISGSNEILNSTVINIDNGNHENIEIHKISNTNKLNKTIGNLSMRNIEIKEEKMKEKLYKVIEKLKNENMEINILEFLEKIIEEFPSKVEAEQYLCRIGILNRDKSGNILKKSSIYPILKIMDEYKITKFYYNDDFYEMWFLTFNGEFINKYDNISSVFQLDEENSGRLFKRCNNEFNPFFEGGGSYDKEMPISEATWNYPFLNKLSELLKSKTIIIGPPETPRPGCVYCATRMEGGFSLQIYSRYTHHKKVTLFYIKSVSGKKVPSNKITFSSSKRYIDALQDRPEQLNEWLEFLINEKRLPINNLDDNGNYSCVIEIIERDIKRFADIISKFLIDENY